MKGQIYQAFVNAGFEREARALSTTVDGKVVPALGHYIAVLENPPSKELSAKESSRLDNASEKLMEFFYNNSDRIGDGELRSDLDGRLLSFNPEDNSVDISFLDKFVEHYQTKQGK